MSELTSQTIPVIMRISLLIRTISQIPNSRHKGNGVLTKALGKKACFIVKVTGACYGLAGQF